MSEFKGTKGEWKMMYGGFTTKGNTPNLIEIYATNEDLEMICKVYKDGLLHQREQFFEANAKLIACAPEMLEILDKIITGYENAGGEMWIPDMIQEHIFTAKKIIKKATE